MVLPAVSGQSSLTIRAYKCALMSFSNTRIAALATLEKLRMEVKASETVSVASHGGPARELSELSLQDDETSRGFSSQQWGKKQI